MNLLELMNLMQADMGMFIDKMINLPLSILGIVMLVFSKWVIKFHMKLWIGCSKRIYRVDFAQHPKLLKSYKIFFTIMWISLSIFLIVVSIF